MATNGHLTTDPRLNGILKSLPEAEYELLSARLRPRRFELGAELAGPNTSRDIVFFPVEGICSVVVTMDNGMSVEVSTVGREGVAGLGNVFGVPITPAYTCQHDLHGFAMVPAELRGIMAVAPQLTSRLAIYAQVQYAEAAQSAACNRLHEAHERLARWLLVLADKAGSDEFEMTHDFIAQMLGSRRPTVSLTARVLQHAGLIDYRRGNIAIIDREGLRASACECYDLIARSYTQLAKATA
ncbi:MAG TPA: Crp/Fnr family transcriptional regulator [Clostridia bacterium]|nr:Crp/Fnr family transcriptional regulator [Clostridia bacterium]